MLIRIFLIFLSLLLGTGIANACDFDDSDGLDVGLVLSGGGAKSSTQVGVMQIKRKERRLIFLVISWDFKMAKLNCRAD